MSDLTADWNTIEVLWRRDLMRFWRQPSRLVGALGQPIIFWGVIGSGMAQSFVLEGTDVGYLQYFYPGVVMMVALFASIFASVSVIEDRHQGFLQAVLVGPGSRAALVLGKCMGSANVALAQIGAFLLLCKYAGFQPSTIHWPMLVATLLLASVALCALGFAVAWFLDNVQAYHAIQMTLLVPLWVVSGAMFPPGGQSPGFALAMKLNPIAYAVTAARHAFYGGEAPASTVLPVSAMVALWVTFFFAVGSVALATWVCQRKA
jgi:daunorubicin resistance ABC transporter membrane protein